MASRRQLRDLEGVRCLGRPASPAPSAAVIAPRRSANSDPRLASRCTAASIAASRSTPSSAISVGRQIIASEPAGPLNVVMAGAAARVKTPLQIFHREQLQPFSPMWSGSFLEAGHAEHCEANFLHYCEMTEFSHRLASLPSTSSLIPALQVVGWRACTPWPLKTGRRAPLAVPFVLAAAGPPSTLCSAYIGRSRGWRAFARH